MGPVVAADAAVARAVLLWRLGSEAAKSYEKAVKLATNDAERRFLERRLHEVQRNGDERPGTRTVAEDDARDGDPPAWRTGVLTLEREWPRPVAGSGEIVVAVKACALNFLDIFTRDGMPGEPTPLPHITGGDVAGIVAETGPGVTQPSIGRRVLLDPSWGCGRCEYCRDGETTRCLRPHMLGEMDPGGLAEYVRIRATQAIPIPTGYGFEMAACLPVAWGTAWRMVVTHGAVTPGDVVVVTAAAGGVGLGAVQIAKLQGARVIALASSDEKLARLKSFGADETINYVTNPDWDADVRRLTAKRGADVIIETVGTSTWERSIRALGKGGRLGHVRRDFGAYRRHRYPLPVPPRASHPRLERLDPQRAASPVRARVRWTRDSGRRSRTATRANGGGRDGRWRAARSSARWSSHREGFRRRREGGALFLSGSVEATAR
jgi:NADPH:quinone reductase-like Zn-dependent oxidoreductase